MTENMGYKPRPLRQAHFDCAQCGATSATFNTIELLATQAESRSKGEEPVSQGAYNHRESFGSWGAERIFSINTAVGRIAVNFGEGKVAREDLSSRILQTL